MTGLEFLVARNSEIASLCRKYGVTRLRTFGSAVRADWDPETSDFDFLAEFTFPPEGINLFHQLFSFSADLEKLLGRPVDVVDWNAAKKPQFRAAAEAEAKELYAA